ncbi:MAG: UPF0042 nucleotide-binding protein [Cellvibrionaceae bacterium]|jgi:UPF0042 nucleotide-binding protein
MRLIIVSGSSGSGKSTALHVLEDMGFICIDNLPASLLPNLVKRINQNDEKQYAVSIDARNSAEDIASLPLLIKSVDLAALKYRVMFLDAEDNVLLRRFSETRRRHPLSNQDTNLQAAITSEKKLLKPIIDIADINIDTSDMGFHDLRDLVKRNIFAFNKSSTSILFQSFGFKYGLPRDADLVFDVRCLPNPHWDISLRVLTGNDEGVIKFLEKEPEVIDMYDDIRIYLERWLPAYEANNRSYMTICIGCTGGQHRSVYLCNILTKHFQKTLDDVQLRHRELNL